MQPGTTFAIITFATGTLFLLVWLYTTAGNPRSLALLGTSFFIFVVALILSSVLLIPIAIFLLPAVPLMMFTAVLEEAWKVFAATSERNRPDRFLLICLFGIWELMIFKPFGGIGFLDSSIAPDRLEILMIVSSAVPPVLMHAVTAAIYAFMFNGRLWIAFVASCCVHLSYNHIIGQFGGSLMASLIAMVVLSLLLLVVLRSPLTAMIQHRRVSGVDV
jgi:hypothetical protein